MKESEIKFRVCKSMKEQFKKKCDEEQISMSNKLNKFILDELNNTTNTVKDIKIIHETTKVVSKITYHQLIEAYNKKFRLIQEINQSYDSDEDFGRNIRLLLNGGI